MRILDGEKLDFSDVLISPKRSTLTSRSEVRLDREIIFRNSQQKYINIPIMAANMDGVGTFEMAEELAKHGLFTCLVKNYPKYELKLWIEEVGYKINNHWAYSMGITDEDLSKFDSVYSSVDSTMIRYVCIDVANGYTERFVNFVKKFRDSYPKLVIIAGNVVTGEMTEELILNGADIVKVGIGPGSVCTTRIKAGVGYPQLSAIIECADSAHGLGGHIIADGGCTCPGDVAKAFGAGADFVMLGGMLAGHDEGGGDKITKIYKTNELDSNGHHINTFETFVKFYGMSSQAANEKHFGGLKNYRSAEGKEVLIPYKGPVVNTVQDILGGMRSTLTYVGAKRLKELSKRTTFVRVNRQVNTVFGS
jgi:GMP reductase